MQNYRLEIRNALEQYPNKDSEEYLHFCHRQISLHYPRIKMHWVKVYGNRWAHLLGNPNDIFYKPLRFKLNDKYALLVDSDDSLPAAELQQLIAILRGCFKDESLPGTGDN